MPRPVNQRRAEWVRETAKKKPHYWSQRAVPNKVRRLSALWVLATVFLMGFLIFQTSFSGTLPHINTRAQEVRSYLENTEIPAPIVVVVGQVVQSVSFVVPLTPVTLASIWVLGSIRGFFYCWVGLVIGQFLCYLIGRFVRRPLNRFSWVTLEKFEHSVLSKSSTLVLILFYMSGGFPFEVLSVCLGVAGYRASRAAFIIATGVLPKLAVITLMGRGLSPGDLRFWALIPVLSVLFFAIGYTARAVWPSATR